MALIKRLSQNLAGIRPYLRIEPFWVLIPLSILLLLLGIASLRWRTELDPPWFLYFSYLIDRHGYIPYRDFFDINMPGSFLLYVIIGRFIDYRSDLMFHIFNLLSFSLLAGVTWAWLKPLGKQVSWAAITLFGLYYMGQGFFLIMQREYFIVLFIACASWVTVGLPRLSLFWRGLLLGLLYGCAMMIKPQSPIGLAWSILWLWFEMLQGAPLNWKTLRSMLALGASASFGLAIPVGITVTYLVATGALLPFIDMATHYWPLYSGLTVNLEILHGTAKLAYIQTMLPRFNDQPLWLIPAAAGGLAAFFPGVLNQQSRRQVIYMLGLIVTLILFVTIPTTFGRYHWLPYAYALMCTCALCFLPHLDRGGSFVKWFPASLLTLSIVLRPTLLPDIVNEIQAAGRGDTYITSRLMRVDAISTYLREHLRSGDTVQPLDWGDSAMHGMLLAEAMPASYFTYDNMLFHDISEPYIQGLRQDFIEEVMSKSPRFAVEIYGNPFLQGSNVAPFPEMMLWLAADYRLAQQGDSYLIYERTALTEHSIKRAAILYPANDSIIADWFPEKAQLDTLNLQQPAVDQPDQVDRAIARLAQKHDALSLIFFSPETSDPNKILEHAASQRLFRLEERWIAGVRAVDYLSNPAACALPEAQTAAFGDAIRLTAASTGIQYMGAARFVCGYFYWQAIQPLTASYKLAMHVLNADGQLVAQYDGIPGQGFSATQTWPLDQPVEDRIAIALPDDMPDGRYEIRVVLYNEASGERLRLLALDGKPDSLLLGTFTLTQP